MTDSRTPPPAGDRLAKVMARSGLCSRRDAEGWIKEGRVTVNGKKVLTPAFNVTDADKIKVDGEELAARQGTRVWLYHKPVGLVVTEKDPEGRPTVFETLAEQGLPRVVSIGRLDINTEGLLLLTNDGGLKRVLEMPATGWLRRYRVRAFGSVTQVQLDTLKHGTEIDGIKYGPIEAELESERGSNVWLTLGLREGKNREVKNVLASLGLQVNRLIRISYGPFQLGDLPIGGVEVVRARVLKEQLGKRLAEEAEVDFESELPEPAALTMRKTATAKANERLSGRGSNTAQIGQHRFRFTDRAERVPTERDETLPRPSRPGRESPDRARRGATRLPPRVEDEGPVRQVLFDDGREPEVFKKKNFGKIQDSRTAEMVEAPRAPRAPRKDGPPGDRPARSFGDKPRRDGADRPKRPFGDKPARDGDRPARPFGDRPARGAGAEDRPKRTYGDRPARPPREGDDRPKRAYGDRPPRGPRPDGDRPARPFAGKPRVDGNARPKRDFGDKPRAPRPDGDRPRSPRPARDKPRAPRPDGDRPRAPRADGARAPSRAGKPGGDKPFRGKPAGGKPAGGKPSGDKPRGPRPPKAR